MSHPTLPWTTTITLAVLTAAGALHCSDDSEPAQPPEVSAAMPDQLTNQQGYAQQAAAPAALSPQFGGMVQSVGQYVVELLPRDDGRLEAQVRDQNGQPVNPHGLELAAEVAREAADDPLQVVMLPTDDRFIGTVAGVDGEHPVRLLLHHPQQPTPFQQTTFPAVPLAPQPASLAPQHQGEVSIVGDTRFEVAAASDGEIHLSVTDLDGRPLPPSAVDLDQLQLLGPSGPQVVPLRVQDAVYVGDLGGPPPPSFSVSFNVGFGSRHYRGVRLRELSPLPPARVVRVPPRFHQPDRWRRDWAWTPLRRGAPRPPNVHVDVSAPAAPRPPRVRAALPAPPRPPDVHVHGPTPPRPNVHVPTPRPPEVHVDLRPPHPRGRRVKAGRPPRPRVRHGRPPRPHVRHGQPPRPPRAHGHRPPRPPRGRRARPAPRPRPSKARRGHRQGRGRGHHRGRGRGHHRGNHDDDDDDDDRRHRRRRGHDDDDD